MLKAGFSFNGIDKLTLTALMFYLFSITCAMAFDNFASPVSCCRLVMLL